MTSVRFEGVEKRFGDVIASRIERLEIPEGKVIAFLGPSGCGKTTALRMIAGLIAQDKGHIYIGERLVDGLPPEERNTAMVFQNYALFPHLSVYDNIAFGLEIRKLPKDAIRRKVEAALELVQLPGMGARLPRQLSGGQQQRVAVARAVVVEPDVLLFDEPLSNLDAKLREYMRFELRKLLEQLRITTVYVTHDQAEAMVVSDRIAVMDRGAVVQLDLPHQVYSRPATRFVADFIGQTSFVPARVRQWNDAAMTGVVDTADGMEMDVVASTSMRNGASVVVCMRPETVRLEEPGRPANGSRNRFVATVESATDFGEYIDYAVRLGKWPLRTKAFSSGRVFRSGEQVIATIDPERAVIVPE
jgi:ABC-type Fe3+/spermidine/putrescine transport system ATPase subunit